MDKDDQPDTRNVPIDHAIIDSRRLQMFYVAAMQGTFATTAHLLGVGPSAVSHAIKSLEQELGCILFKRTGPQVSPTWQAMRLLPTVETVLLRMGSIKTELAAMAARAGRLEVAVTPSARGGIRPGVLSDFRKCFPDASVEITPSDDESDSREFDFTMGYDHDVPGNCVHIILTREDLGMYAAPQSGPGRGTRISIGQLRQSTLVFPDQTACELIIEGLFRGPAPGVTRWIMPDAAMARDIALQGQCLAFLPAWVLGECVADGRLNVFSPPGVTFHRNLCAWWRCDRPPSPMAEVFLELLSADLKGDPAGR